LCEFWAHFRFVGAVRLASQGPRPLHPVIKGETEEQFDNRFEAWFNNEDIDEWELKQGLNVLYGHDVVPQPRIVAAMLRASRRLNDIAMSIRILEAVNEKGAHNSEVYNYIIENVRPVLDELGISTPEELGLDKVQQISAYTSKVLGLNATPQVQAA
jgi:cytochrome c oxidase subunit 5a